MNKNIELTDDDKEDLEDVNVKNCSEKKIENLSRKEIIHKNKRKFDSKNDNNPETTNNNIASYECENESLKILKIKEKNENSQNNKQNESENQIDGQFLLVQPFKKLKNTANSNLVLKSENKSVQSNLYSTKNNNSLYDIKVNIIIFIKKNINL